MENETNNSKSIWRIENRTKYFVYVLVGLSIVSVALFALLVSSKNSLDKEKKVAAKEKVNQFENLNLQAEGVVVFDVINDREIFSKNGDEPLPLASLTKVLTAVVTSEKLRDNQEVKIAAEYLSPEGDSKLLVGDTWQVDDLRDFTLLTSSNDGAFALATISEIKKDKNQNNIPVSGDNLRVQFIRDMNSTAEKIGLSNSKFFNVHGLDKDADRGGAYGTAHDMALLFKYTLKNHPEILEATRYENLEFTSGAGVYSATNTNKFVDQIPDLIASKTGFTDLAGGNLVIAFNAGINRPIIISVLDSTEEGRFTDVLKLVKATINQLPNL